MKILFSHSYFYRFDPKQWEMQQPFPPLMSIQAAAVARACGHETDFADSNLAAGPEHIRPYLNRKPDRLILYDDGFNYLTKMCLTNMREAAFEMIRMAAEYGIPTWVNSSDASDHYQKYLDAGAELVIIGEGEETLKDLLLQDEISLETTAGIAFKSGDEVKVNPKRPVMRDLDALPGAAWDLIDFHAYKQAWSKSGKPFTLNLATTRGCPFKCNWCAKPIYGNRYHSRSPEKVVDEIEWLQQQTGVRHFWMTDDIFGLKPGWVQKFRDELNRRNLKIRYKIQSRADLLLQDDNLAALAASGLEEAWIGAESGSQKILDAMDKGITVEQIREATRKLKTHGIRVCFFLQFGYLGETREDIDKTIDMVNELVPDDIGISVSYPLPGTKFHEKVKSDLDSKTNWTDSDDLAMMFRNTYQPAFYRRLHRYVHKRFRKAQGFDHFSKLFSGKKWKLRPLIALGYYIPAEMLERRKLAKLQRENG